MRVIFYLLDTLFFLLVAATLLRAWMNQLRVNMAVQPGRLAIAVTDWLVAPVRRALPRHFAQSRVDWGSLVAALLLALVYASLWLLVAVGFAGTSTTSVALTLAIPAMALKLILRTLLQGMMFLLLAYVVLSWVQPNTPVMSVLERLTAPLLKPLRRWIPMVGGVDLSVLVLVILLQIGLMIVG